MPMGPYETARIILEQQEAGATILSVLLRETATKQTVTRSTRSNLGVSLKFSLRLI